jgi:hypothetical protein
MERRGIDPRSVEFWNPRVFRDEQQEAARIEGPDVEAGHVTPEAADVHSAAQLATNPAAFKGTHGWSLIPKAVHDEIMTDIRPSGIGGPVVRHRQGQDQPGPARQPRLASVPGRLQRVPHRPRRHRPGRRGQGAGVVAQAAGGAEARDRAVHRRPSLVRRPDAPRRAANNRIVNAYRAFKETALYKAAHKANPLDALFRPTTRRTTSSARPSSTTRPSARRTGGWARRPGRSWRCRSAPPGS